jgi:hypothetical protein
MDWLLELTSEGLTVTADEEARRFENRIDGKLIVETSCGELGAEELILRYKELAHIECQGEFKNPQVGEAKNPHPPEKGGKRDGRGKQGGIG